MILIIYLRVDFDWFHKAQLSNVNIKMTAFVYCFTKCGLAEDKATWQICLKLEESCIYKASADSRRLLQIEECDKLLNK